MRNDKNSKPQAHAEQEKSIFVFRVVGIVIENRPFIVERRLSFIETDTMILEIGLRLGGIPIESEGFYTYIVCTTSR